MGNKKFITIHGHFYQPPRENPWLEYVESQPDAAPYRNWNERISDECYSKNASANVVDQEANKTLLLNNYSYINFNFGPTLLSWLQQYDLPTYQAIITADHGNAIAQCYNHIIMPLASAHDKKTQVEWGIRDFIYRFKRKPEGMWLPETAVDLSTLELLAENNITYTILAPRQAKQVRKIGTDKWHLLTKETIDTRMPYCCSLPSGKTIAIFFYNGSLSKEIAFDSVLTDGTKFAEKLLTLFDGRNNAQLSHIANDGETYGHHHRFGEMALAFCLHYLQKNNLAHVTDYQTFLMNNPPTHEVEIKENTSWSCEHGIKRWHTDCGCHTGTNPQWQQKWRKPLRETMDWLKEKADAFYIEHLESLTKVDPWAVRNNFIEVLLDRNQTDKFLHENFPPGLSKKDITKALELMELQKNALFMYTSCGWFFDDISNLATIQILQYAARVIHLMEKVGGTYVEENFFEYLENIPGNSAKYPNALVLYEKEIKPKAIDLLHVGVHYGISSLFRQTAKEIALYCYAIKCRTLDIVELDHKKLIVGNADIKSLITREEKNVSFTAANLGDYNIIAAAQYETGETSFYEIQKKLKQTFLNDNIDELKQLMEDYFDETGFNIGNLFKDDRNQILQEISEAALKSLEKIPAKHAPDL